MRQRSVLARLLATVADGDADDLTIRLLQEFGSIGRTLRQSDEAKRRVVGDAPDVIALLGAARDALDEALRSEIIGEPVEGEHPALTRYLVLTMGSLNEETLRILFLGQDNRLLAEEQMATGTVAKLSVYPRLVFRRALELGAAKIIMVHNHPSGDGHPSDDDLRTTASMLDLGKALEIDVADHLIIAGRKCTSLRRIGLMR